MWPDARLQAWKNRRRSRWNTVRMFSGRVRRRWLQIVRRIKIFKIWRKGNRVQEYRLFRTVLGTAEPDIVEPVRGCKPEPVCGSHKDRSIVPGPTAEHLILATKEALRLTIRLLAVIVLVIPVRHPPTRYRPYRRRRRDSSPPRMTQYRSVPHSP